MKYKNQKFCFVNEQKSIVIIIFGDNLRVICESQNVFGDGTFPKMSVTYKRCMYIHTIIMYQ
jgi:hypothetical protein